MSRVLEWHRHPVRLALIASAAAVVVWDAGRTTFSDDAGRQAWLDWVGVGFVAYGTVLMFVIVPRVLEARARSSVEPERAMLQVASIRFAAAMTPVVVGFALVGAGADLWVLTATLVASLSYVVVYAMRTSAAR